MNDRAGHFVLLGIAAAALYLLRKPVMQGFYHVESDADDWQEWDARPTIGDTESNFIEDAAAHVMSKFSNWPAGSAPYKTTIENAAAASNVPVSILAWLLWQESRYRPEIIDGRKRSIVGAMGIAQFMGPTAVEWLGSEAAALDPAKAIPGAARYLRWLHNRTGSWSKALAAYNWGIGNVQRKGLERAPAETRNYYSEILELANSGGSAYA